MVIIKAGSVRPAESGTSSTQNSASTAATVKPAASVVKDAAGTTVIPQANAATDTKPAASVVKDAAGTTATQPANPATDQKPAVSSQAKPPKDVQTEPSASGAKGYRRSRVMRNSR
jgi:hypothetical protein